MKADAYVLHQLPGRVRLKIPDRAGQPAYFDELEKQLSSFQRFEKIRTNHQTGSIVLQNGKLDLGALSDYAEEKDLFVISRAPAPAKPLSDNLMAPITNANKSLKERTQGRIDLAEVAFGVMMVIGIIRLIRGRLSAPPWYTAFWYAYGISKILVKRRDDKDKKGEEAG